MNAIKRTLACWGLLIAIGGFVFLHGAEIRGRRIVANAAGQGATVVEAKGTKDASGVMYFSHQETALAFKQPLAVYDGVPEKKNYRVSVFHRDKGGEVEIHNKDTDVFYILEGEATFVTGGTVTGGKEAGPDEIRIATMEGGVTRKIGKGDVIVIPANVTHWFKEVEKPVTYFGVKVR
jgi:quercetin dioxygenase-like cupin family protein